jgi:hypothetical protein
LFSYSYELFCAVQNHISFVFMQFHTLSQKHPGVGALLPARFAEYPTLQHEEQNETTK